ncbi:radical SAM protein [Clostridium beijerinckii]|uniref:radical SAM protein n=1 Tax=Clostridium beijerinckii TaxID=1520 RepID=UPI00098C7534|nr:radical SAM protein [Clostridium beijerinckii]MBA8932420.1 biotin synthase [Clostridium beijerinckii]NRT37610.1 biotin synthase [Clostridium beijerinckii]NRT48647.1 biotin synthase [Clostridium beijerinckii]NRU36624.1 biotin synthase [Clostridium beijerinckii]NRZ23057.1 biotin synthase [Clostridium beijerinckii]
MDKNIFLSLINAKGEQQKELFEQACNVRTQYCGNKVALRAVIEISNFCECNCLYCGMRKNNSQLKRNKLDIDSIFNTISIIRDMKIGTLMIQSGQDNSYDSDSIEKIIKYAKDKGISNVILCLGYRAEKDYHKFFNAGANKYIMKFETSNPSEYKKLKNGEELDQRLTHIKRLKKIGYVVGSGNICGLPLQSDDDLYQDLQLINEMDGNLASVSPFISNKESPLSECMNADIDKALNFLAIMRITLKDALIPSVSAFEILRKGGQLDAFRAGANVITINMTPDLFRNNYLIYDTNRKIVKYDYAKEIIKLANLNIVNE